MCHLNIRSIRKNLSAFEILLNSLHHGFSLIGITETWLKDEDCDLYNIPGYKMVERHRQNRSGGGIAIFIKDCFEFTIRSDLCTFNEYMESIFIEISGDLFNSKRNIIVGVIYRIPNTNMTDFNTNIAGTLEQLRMGNQLVYLMGDYNIDLLNSERHDLTGEFVDIMYSNEFLPLISRPTRISSTSATLIDNIFTNNHDDLNSSLNGILVTDISDHFPIFHINQSFTAEETVSYLVTRLYNERNKQNFIEALSTVEWSAIYNTSDTQGSFDLFHSKLISLHDSCFPKITIKKKYSNRKPWLSDDLRTAIRYKNKLFHNYKKVPTIRNETAYKSYRNELNRKMKMSEKLYYRELIISHKDNTRKSWMLIKNIINKHRKPNIQTKFRLNDGTVTTDKKIISDSFNNFFTSIGPTLAKAIPSMNKSPLYSMGNRILESIYLQPVTCEEIIKLLSSLKSTAGGWDDLNAMF